MFNNNNNNNNNSRVCFCCVDKQTEVTSSVSLSVNHVTSDARENSIVTSSAVTSSRELMTSPAEAAAAAAAEDAEDEVMTSSSRNDDENDDDDDDDDAGETLAVTTPSAAELMRQVDLGPDVSVSGLVFHLRCRGSVGLLRLTCAGLSGHCSQVGSLDHPPLRSQ